MEAAYVLAAICVALKSRMEFTITDHELLDALKARLAAGLLLAPEFLSRLGVD